METAIINGICRCCASEGAFKDIRSAYQWMGAEEIYADMLKECFDLSLWSSGEGDDGGICEVCVTQLRNASNFKKQVLHTEEQFKKHLHTRLFKPSIVKVELPANDGIDSDDNISAEEGYSGTDYEVSAIKVESPEESKPKKRSAKMSTRASTSRAKKAKGDAGESSTKRGRKAKTHALKLLAEYKDENVEVKPEHEPDKKVKDGDDAMLHKIRRESEKKRKSSKSHKYESDLDSSDKDWKDIEEYNDESMKKEIDKDEVDKYRHNIRQILLYSNATPIKLYKLGYVCCFCDDEYPDSADLKKHNLTEHNSEEIKNTFMKTKGMFNFVVNLDITELNCNLCNVPMDTVENLEVHLRDNHEKKFYTNLRNYILPFKFDGNPLIKCILCDRLFNTFKMIQRHMCSHYKNYTCEHCGACFMIERMVKQHAKIHENGVFKCNKCSEVFDSMVAKRKHDRHQHNLFTVVCPLCNERFKSQDKKASHLSVVHGINTPLIECQACGKGFRVQARLTRHIKENHLLEMRLNRRYKCTECSMGFYFKSKLTEHMVIHTGVKAYKCEVCTKTFARKKTLKQHMGIHDYSKRIKCELCGQAFVQRVCWKLHMRSKHGGIP